MTLKKSNPEFPILVRECSGVQARVWARYGESDRMASWDIDGFTVEMTTLRVQLEAESARLCFCMVQ